MEYLPMGLDTRAPFANSTSGNKNISVSLLLCPSRTYAVFMIILNRVPTRS